MNMDVVVKLMVIDDDTIGSPNLTLIQLKIDI